MKGGQLLGVGYSDIDAGQGSRQHIASINPSYVSNASSFSCFNFYSPSHHRYMDIPVISRLYFTGAFLTTAGCALDIISPFSLYFNFDLIFHQGQFWRLITTYLFFGMFSIDFLFHMYFLVSWECLLCIYWNVLFLI